MDQNMRQRMIDKHIEAQLEMWVDLDNRYRHFETLSDAEVKRQRWRLKAIGRSIQGNARRILERIERWNVTVPADVQETLKMDLVLNIEEM